MGYSTQVWGPGVNSTARDPRYTTIGTSSKHVDLVISGRFCEFLAPGTISTARDPGTRKLGRHQNSSIWSFLAVFRGYST